MALILTESFDWLAANSTYSFSGGTFDGKWTGSSTGIFTSLTGAGRHSLGARASSGSNSTSILNYSLTASEQDNTLVMGGACMWTSNTSCNLFQMQSDTQSVVQTTVYYDATGTGTLKVFKGTNSGTLLGSVSNISQFFYSTLATVWGYIEVKVKLTSGATGTVDLCINGINVLSLTSQTTSTNSTTTFDGIAYFSSSVVWLDDLYVLNSLGSSANDFLGDVTISCSKTNNNGNYSMGTGSDGNSTDNYLLENDLNDATYVDLAATDDKDTYNFVDVTASTNGVVKGVINYARLKKTDSGARTMAQIVRLSGTDTLTSDLAVTQLFKWYKNILNTKPGGSSWTFTDINAAEFGVAARP